MGSALEGAVNVSGPILLVYFLLLELPAAVVIGTMTWVFLFGKVTQTALFAVNGTLAPGLLAASLPLAALSAVGFIIGYRLRARFDPARYRGWLKATLALVVIILLLRAAGVLA
jgi:hypothetical protein